MIEVLQPVIKLQALQEHTRFNKSNIVTAKASSSHTRLSRVATRPLMARKHRTVCHVAPHVHGRICEYAEQKKESKDAKKELSEGHSAI